MIYLLLTILCGSALNLAFALAGKMKLDTLNITLFNYAAACIVSAANLFRSSGAAGFSTEGLGSYTIPIAVFAGFAHLIGFIFLQKSVIANGPSASAMYNRLAMVIPILISIFVFREAAGLLRWSGIVLAIIGLVMYNWEGGFKINALLMGTWFTCGCAELTNNLFARLCDPEDKPFFMMLVFGISSLLTACILAKRKGPKFTGREVTFGIMLGVINLSNASLTVSALEALPTTIVYPVLSVSVIIITSLVGRACFGDRFCKRQLVALGITLVALVALNL